MAAITRKPPSNVFIFVVAGVLISIVFVFVLFVIPRTKPVQIERRQITVAPTLQPCPEAKPKEAVPKWDEVRNQLSKGGYFLYKYQLPDGVFGTVMLLPFVQDGKEYIRIAASRWSQKGFHYAMKNFPKRALDDTGLIGKEVKSINDLADFMRRKGSGYRKDVVDREFGCTSAKNQ